MKKRSSKSAILGRFGIFGASFGVTCFYIATALGLAVTIGPFILADLLGVGVLVLICWSGVRLIGFLFYGQDRGYQQFLEEVGDPYLDFLPPPFNVENSSPQPNHIARCPGCGNFVDEPTHPAISKHQV